MQTSKTMSKMSEKDSKAIDTEKKIRDLDNKVKELEGSLRNRDAEISNLKADNANLKNSNSSEDVRYEGLMTRHAELREAYEALLKKSDVKTDADRGDVVAAAQIVCEVAGRNLDPSPLAEAIGTLRGILDGDNTF